MGAASESGQAAGERVGLMGEIVHAVDAGVFERHAAAFAIGGLILWYLPYRKLDSLYFAAWIQRVQMLLALYTGLALMACIPAFAEPPELWLPGAIMNVGASVVGGAILSLLIEQRWLRPKI